MAGKAARERLQVAVEEVLTAEARWAEAHRNLDLEALDSILAEDYQQIASDGSTVDKGQLLASYGSGERRWRIAESSDLDVEVAGEIAVVTGLWRGVGTNGGVAFDYHARFLAVYRNEEGTWRLFREASIPLR